MLADTSRFAGQQERSLTLRVSWLDFSVLGRIWFARILVPKLRADGAVFVPCGIGVAASGTRWRGL